MNAKTKFKTNAFAAIHTSATSLHKINAISKTVMRDFTTACMAAPAEIKPQPVVGVTDALSRDGR